MVSCHNDLQNIRIDGVPDKISSAYWFLSRGRGSHSPSPSSVGSEDTSNVIQPSGLSSVTTRTSWRSLGPVPARIANVDGV